MVGGIWYLHGVITTPIYLQRDWDISRKYVRIIKRGLKLKMNMLLSIIYHLNVHLMLGITFG